MKPDLENLEAIFDMLRNGRHISAEDKAIFISLAKREEEYRDLFKSLGFIMKRHPADFFYFDAAGRQLTGGARRMALFMFVLMDSISDSGNPIEETLLTSTFTIGTLPHLKSERYRRLMRELDVVDDDGLERIVSALERGGFAKVRGSEFEFQPPVHRFFDAAYESARLEKEEKESETSVE